MSVNRQSRSTPSDTGTQAPADANRERREDLREAAERIDEAEDELKEDIAEAKEKTEEAGYRTTGPLHDE